MRKSTGQSGATHFNERCPELVDSLGDEAMAAARDSASSAKVVRPILDAASLRATPHLYGALKCQLKVVGDIDAPAHAWSQGKYDQPWCVDPETATIAGELDTALTGSANPDADEVWQSTPSERTRFKASGPRC